MGRLDNHHIILGHSLHGTCLNFLGSQREVISDIAILRDMQEVQRTASQSSSHADNIIHTPLTAERSTHRTDIRLHLLPYSATHRGDILPILRILHMVFRSLRRILQEVIRQSNLLHLLLAVILRSVDNARLKPILKQAPIQNHDRREGRHAELTRLQYRIARMQVME